MVVALEEEEIVEEEIEEEILEDFEEDYEFEYFAHCETNDDCLDFDNELCCHFDYGGQEAYGSP